jgi:hypothetical protein
MILYIIDNIVTTLLLSSPWFRMHSDGVGNVSNAAHNSVGYALK